MNSKPLLITALILLGVLLGVFVSNQSLFSSNYSASIGDIGTGEEKAEPSPPVILAFLSLSSPDSKKHFLEVFPELRNNASIDYELHLLSDNESDAYGAIAARCVKEEQGENGYFDMVEKLFRSTPPFLRSSVTILAQELHVNLSRFILCLEAKSPDVEMHKERAAVAKRYAVETVPTFLIGDRRLEGDVTLPSFDQASSYSITK